jgi:hypothetical protein
MLQRRQRRPRKDHINLLGMRQRSASLRDALPRTDRANFDDFRGRRQLTGNGLTLGLVGEGELGFHLAGQRLAESIGRVIRRRWKCSTCVSKRSPSALGAPPSSNPVGATRLAGAFLRTFHDADLSETLQPLLFRQYEHELSKVLGDLYGRSMAACSPDSMRVTAKQACGGRLRRTPKADGSGHPRAQTTSVRRRCRAIERSGFLPKRASSTSGCATCCMPGAHGIA